MTKLKHYKTSSQRRPLLTTLTMHCEGDHDAWVYLCFISTLILSIHTWRSYINDAKNKKPEEATCYSREEIFERMVERSNAQISITAYYKVKNINFLKRRTKYIGQNVSYYPNSVKTFKIIQTCGDIQSNPGPKKKRVLLRNVGNIRAKNAASQFSVIKTGYYARTANCGSISDALVFPELCLYHIT